MSNRTRTDHGIGCRPLNATRALIALLSMLACAVHAAPFVYVTQPSSVAIVDAATNSVTATIPVGDLPYGIVVTRSGARGYAANRGSDTVAFLDLLANGVTAIVPVASAPTAIALSADETRLFVASRNPKVVSVIDVASRAIIATIALPDLPRSIALHPSGLELYVLYDSAPSIGVVDTASNTLSTTLDNRDDLLAGDFAVSPPGDEIYVANWAFRSLLLPPASDIVTVIDTIGAAPIASISVGDQVNAVTFAGDTHKAYVAALSHVGVIDTSSRTVVGLIPVTAGSVAITYLAALHRVYVSNYWSNVVTVIDAATSTVLTTIPITGPGYMAVVPTASAPPVSEGPKPALSIPVPRPHRPVVTPRPAFTRTN